MGHKDQENKKVLIKPDYVLKLKRITDEDCIKLDFLHNFVDQNG